jgi:hypothetical protein
MDDLSLQVAEIDNVEIDEPERAHTCRRQVQSGRRSQAAGADTQHARALEPLLPLLADFRQQQMAAVALPFAGREFAWIHPGSIIPALRFCHLSPKLRLGVHLVDPARGSRRGRGGRGRVVDCG